MANNHFRLGVRVCTNAQCLCVGLTVFLPFSFPCLEQLITLEQLFLPEDYTCRSSESQ